jgi:two-component sensor histidine kinase
VQIFDYQLERGGRTFYREATFLLLGDDEVLSVLRDISEQRRLEQNLIDREQQMWAIFSALPDVIAQFSRDGVYLGDIHSGHFDAEIPLEQAQGKTFFEMDILPADTAKALHAALEETFTTQKEHSHEYDLDINGKTYYREMRFVYLREDTCLGILRDITPWREMDIALQNALEHSTVLLKEVHHRVRNNLQVLSSVLHLHAASLDDELAKRVLLENRRRIQTLALVHRVLYDNNSYANIALDNYLRSSIGLFAADMQRMKVALELNADRVSADLDHAIPFGLIVNELINNCLRHAFVSERYQSDAMSAQLQVSLQQQDNHVTLQIIDNGVGLPDDFANKQARTLGMSVIHSLSEQLSGTFSICNRDDIQGTHATLTFTC